MSNQYEKARAIAEAAANHWDKFGDTAGVQWLADAIMALGDLPQDDGSTVVGLPMLVRRGRDYWFVLGEDGARFRLVRDPLPAPATPQEETP